MKSRAWCFTDNQPSDQHINAYRLMVCKYLVCGEETAPDTGHKHLQGYVYFDNAISFKSVSNRFPGCHIEAAKGSPLQNRDYCMKEGHSFEIGTCPEQGRRSDISAIKDLVTQGKQMRELIPICNSYQALRTAELLIKYQPPPIRTPPRVVWLWGPTGRGKTRFAMEMAGNDYWISSKSLVWWDGYCGQKTVIFDELRSDFCEFSDFLRIIDRYPYRVNIKGGSCWLCADTIIITSCYDPSFLWHRSPEDHEQLARRITEVIAF